MWSVDVMAVALVGLADARGSACVAASAALVTGGVGEVAAGAFDGRPPPVFVGHRLGDVTGPPGESPRRPAPVTKVDYSFLRITMDVVAGVTADLVSPAERAELVAALRLQLAEVPAYHGSAGSCLAYAFGPVVDVSPATPLVRVQDAVREVIRQVCGAAACTWSQTKPHISLGYCHTATDSDPWARRLRKIDPNHVPLRITSVALVDVRPDNISKRLEWPPVASTHPPGR